jgi:hypothetical protein
MGNGAVRCEVKEMPPWYLENIKHQCDADVIDLVVRKQETDISSTVGSADGRWTSLTTAEPHIHKRARLSFLSLMDRPALLRWQVDDVNMTEFVDLQSCQVQ